MKILNLFNLKKWKSLIKSKKGGIFDEAMLLGAKGLILIIIISGFVLAILSVISKFSGFLEMISDQVPEG